MMSDSVSKWLVQVRSINHLLWHFLGPPTFDGWLWPCVPWAETPRKRTSKPRIWFRKSSFCLQRETEKAPNGEARDNKKETMRWCMHQTLAVGPSPHFQGRGKWWPPSTDLKGSLRVQWWRRAKAAEVEIMVHWPFWFPLGLDLHNQAVAITIIMVYFKVPLDKVSWWTKVQNQQ